MASIGNDAGGRRRILFVAPDGKRKTIRLGKVAIRQAQSIKTYVEKLVAAQAMGIAPDDDAVRWLASRVTVHGLG
ncbi:MAG: hypothetical protein IT424_09395 [Pirellulales bacterium]|nr:hypothetical protein [Pirellulales bacterium]